MSPKREKKIVNPVEIRQGRAEFCLLGLTPLIYHTMSAKVMQQLLLPPKKENDGGESDDVEAQSLAGISGFNLQTAPR